VTPQHPLAVRNRSQGAPLGERVEVADNFRRRLLGLLGRPPLKAGEGLLITPSRGVHMFGMRYPLDVVLADAGRQVVACFPCLRPWHTTGIHAEARYALELPPGTIERTGTEPGDQLEWNS
jgi:uncharacterized protein